MKGLIFFNKYYIWFGMIMAEKEEDFLLDLCFGPSIKIAPKFVSIKLYLTIFYVTLSWDRPDREVPNSHV